MTHNALSRSMGKIPMWVVQAAVGILFSSIVAWTTWATATTQKHETRIAVTETTTTSIKEDIKELKEGQKDNSRKLDEIKLLLIRRGRNQ